MSKPFLFILSLFLLIACAKPKEVEEIPPKTKALRHAEFLRDSAQFTDSNGTKIDAISYFLRGKVDWKNKKLISEVSFVFKLIDFAESTLLLDSHVSKVFKVLHHENPLPFKELKKKGLLEISLSSLSESEKQDTIELKIAYETAARSEEEDTGFEIISPRKDDPIRAKVAYTFAEPESASTWMPCHNTPSDRALFGSEFVIENGETLISNGDLTQDEILPNSSGHVMAYQTKYTLPPYLMAFSVGEYEVKTLHSNSLPISVVSRKGLRVDSKGILSRLVQFISRYEKLTVKYPFEKYMVVLIPDFISGGIEHAGITFQSEERSSQARMSSDLSLIAHELAHQWFGDLLTIRSWDDLWIKEGMATLLAEEAMRFAEDQNNKGRLFGKNFAVVATEAVVDPTLKPDAKYTSGPYDRAAWVYTQVRSHLGEKTFWNMLKKALTENAYGVIGTEELLTRYIAPTAGKEFAVKMKKALFAKTLPVLNAETRGEEIEITLHDPEEILLSPFLLRSVSPLNTSQSSKLSSHNSSFKFKKGELLLLNLGDTHPLTSLFEKKKSNNQDVWKNLVPHSLIQLSYLSELSADQPSNAVAYGDGWSLSSNQYEFFYNRLNSEDTKFQMLKLGCTVAKKAGATGHEQWAKVLSNSAKNFPLLGMPRYLESGLSTCEGLIDPTLFKPHWNKIANKPNDPALTETDLLKFANFPGSSAEAFHTFKPIVEKGFSVRSKMIAMMRLNNQFKGSTWGKPQNGETSDWLLFFRSVLDSSELTDLLLKATDAVVSASDKDALPPLKRVVEATVNSKARSAALCGAYKILKEDPAEWESFKNSLSSELPNSLKSLLNNPEKCGDVEDNLW